MNLKYFSSLFDKVCVSYTIIIGLVVITMYGVSIGSLFFIYIPLSIVLILVFVKLYGILRVLVIPNEYSVTVELFNNIIQIFAFLFAAIYFLYQIAANVDITNLDIEIDSERLPIDSDSSYLLIDVKLKKGAMASVFLHDIKAYLYIFDTIKYDSVTFYGLNKSDISIGSESNAYTTYNKAAGHYRIGANESTQFSAFKKVPIAGAFRIEIIVITERRKLFHNVQPQFKATAISLPHFGKNEH